METRIWTRIALLIVIIALLIPPGIAAIQASNETSATNSDLRQSATNVTFVTTQGGSVHVYEHAGQLEVIHTNSRKRIWLQDKYRRYMDIDPLGPDRILVVAGEQTGSDEFNRIAVVLNWRTGEELQKFDVPIDTHDVDHVKDDRFAVAAKANHSAYILNTTTGEITWRYDFRSDFGAESGDEPISSDWTHLNDIDLHPNHNGVLLSPRDFDRVIYVNKSSKEVEWTLGEQDNHDILKAQHNPVILQFDPLTVLVADSENARIVEYQRTSKGEWNRTWSYSEELRWPRDADRLPNGNTLIADTNNNRVIEVTPSGEVVWEYTSDASNTYDVERLEYGDEPRGPPMTMYNTSANGEHESSSLITSSTRPLKASYNYIYQMIGAWLLPPFIGLSEFMYVLSAAFLTVGWLSVETVIRIPAERIHDNLTVPELSGRLQIAIGVCVSVMGVLLLWSSFSSPRLTGVYVAAAIILLNIGYASLRLFLQENILGVRVDLASRASLGIASAVVAVLLIRSQLIAQRNILLYIGLAIAVVSTFVITQSRELT